MRVTKYPNGKLKSLHIPFSELENKELATKMAALDFANKAEWIGKLDKIQEKYDNKKPL